MKGVVALLLLSGCQSASNGAQDRSVLQDMAGPCFDRTRNFDETDVDCGGPTCARCGPGQSCKLQSDCAGSLNCDAGRCTLRPLPDLAVRPALTGEPCAFPVECAGLKPQCITKDLNGEVWPGGYCASACNPAKNDPMTGLNFSCPGVGTCSGQGTNGLCFAACTARSGNMPCRAGYSCFAGGNNNLTCLPDSYSECKPSQCGGGGCPPAKICSPIGLDDVGSCIDSCDPFAQACPDRNGLPQACCATPECGEGFCSPPFGGGGDGVACMYNNSCDPGFACHDEGMAKFCRPYCGGPNNVPCPNNRACVQLFPKISVATVGVCAP